MRDSEKELNRATVKQDGPALTGTRARQGVTGHNVRYVLFVATASVIISFGLIVLAWVTRP